MKRFLPLLLVLLACTQPAHKVGAINTNNAQKVGAWWIDPANVSTHASDSNDCQSAITPCLSLGQIVSRFGTKFPTFAQSVVFTFLSDDVAADPWNMTPDLIGGGGVVVQGVPTVLATVTLGTYTAPNYAAGTKPTITASGHTGAFWTTYVGAIVHDTTANASFIIDSDVGTATATVTTPFATPVVEIPAGPATIANGDTLTILKLPMLYGISIDYRALGDFSSATPGFTFTLLTINAEFELTLGPQVNLIDDVMAVPETFSNNRGEDTAPSCTNCSFGVSGGLSGGFLIFGGSMSEAGQNFQNLTQLDGDVYVNQRIHYGFGSVQLRRVYFGQTNDTDSTTADFQVQQSNMSDSAHAARVWGPGGMSVANGMKFQLGAGSATSTLLLRGTLSIEGSSTACANDLGDPALVHCGRTITAAAIDQTVGLGGFGGIAFSPTGSAIFIGH